MHPNSTSESTPRAKKRRRGNDKDNDAHQAQNPRRSTQRQTIDTATEVNDPHHLLGTRLEPIMETLAAQPEDFQTYIIKSSRSMLEWIDKIKLHRSNSKIYYTPIIDP